MSLDVYLELPNPVIKSGTGVFVRENGQNRELSVEEIKEKWPNYECECVDYEDNEAFSANITHNLNEMASQVPVNEKLTLYDCLWRPEEANITIAEELAPLLRVGLTELKRDPGKYKQYNPENGWGSYEGLVSFVENYLRACEDYSRAVVKISR